MTTPTSATGATRPRRGPDAAHSRAADLGAPEPADVIDLESVYRRDPYDPSALVADGYGLSIRVERGHLVIADGIGQHRRTRKLARVERAIRRIVILGHTGTISLPALAWCRHVGIALVQLDPDGAVLLAVGAAGRDDPRLRRAQALAPTRPVGLVVTRTLIRAKIDGQAAVLHRLGETVADTLRGCSASLDDCDSLHDVAETEAKAARTYFGVWTRRVTPTFATRDEKRVPAHWLTFGGRASVLAHARSPRKAADPLNAILNYCYALSEAETRIALTAVGLDPGLGIMHTDSLARDSLALDVMEPVRPLVNQTILDLLNRRRLQAVDFCQAPDGHCRILAPLTHELADTVHSWLSQVGVTAEQVAHAIAADSTAPIPLRTPLTGANRKAANTKTSGRRVREQPRPQTRA